MNKKSPIPLYHQLAERIQSDINSGKYQPGDKIPSETVLATSFAIGRPTVRQAIESLVRKRLLVRRRGSGTYVAESPERVDLFSLAGTIASFKTSKRDPQVKVLEQPRLIEVSEQSINPFNESTAIFLSRRTMVDSTPVLVEDIFFDAALFSGLQNMNIEGISLSQLVEDTFHFALAGGTQHFGISYPDKRLSGLLNLPRTMPLLAVNRFLHSSEMPNAIYSDLYCRTDKFIFSQSLGGFTHG